MDLGRQFHCKAGSIPWAGKYTTFVSLSGPTAADLIVLPAWLPVSVSKNVHKQKLTRSVRSKRLRG